MANIIRQGTTPAFGITVDNMSSSWATSMTLADSFNVDSAYREHEQTNHIGQPIGWMAYYQDLTFSLSATVVHDPEAATSGIFAPISGHVLGNNTGAELSLANFAMNTSIAPLIDQGIFGAPDASGQHDFSSFTVITKQVGTAQSAGGAATYNTSGQIYKWGEVASAAN